MVSMELEWLLPITSVLFTLLAFIGGVLGYLYGPYWKLRRVPGPLPLPLVGHLPLLAKYGPDVFSVLAKQYGPIYRFHMGRQPLIIVADAELCKEVGIKKFKDITNRSIPSPISASPLHQKGLFFTRDSRWSTMRNTILSVYQPSHLSSLVPKIQSFIESATLKNLHDTPENEDIIFSNFSLMLATDIIGDAAFGVNFGLSSNKSIKHNSVNKNVAALAISEDGALNKITPLSTKRASQESNKCAFQKSNKHPSQESNKCASQESNMCLHSYERLSSLPLIKQLVGNRNVATEISASDDDEELSVKNFINQHIYSTTQLKMDLSGSFSIILGLIVPFLQEPFRQILKRIPGTMDWKIEIANKRLSGILDEIVRKRIDERNRSSKNFLSLILNARESRADPENVFTPDYVSAVAYEHLLAGSATTSFTLSSIVYLVASHPKVEEKLIREIDGFGPADWIPNAQDLYESFPYLDQVIKEAMRFYTVSPLVARETSNEVEIGGYLLPKGTWVWLALGVLAKDSRHFPEPEKFKPERFDPKCEEMKTRHPYAFIPFGIGPRACIGQKFSLLEIKLSLIHLYRKYVFRHSPNMEKPVELEYGIVLNFKHGIKLRVIKRTK